MGISHIQVHTGSMRVHFHRIDDHGTYAVLMWRHDGLTVRLLGDDHDRRIPHELAHLVTERELRLPHGVFGSIEAGAMFGAMSVLEGRPRYDARARSRAVIRAYSTQLGLAEVLSGVVHEGVEHDVNPRSLHRQLAGAWGSLRPDPFPYRLTEVAHCLRLLLALAARWHRVEAGGRLALRWEIATERPDLPVTGRRRSPPQPTLAPAERPEPLTLSRR